MAARASIVRRVSVTLGALLLICASGFLWIRHELNHLSFHFSSPTKEELAPLVTTIKAAVANVAVIKQPGSPTPFTNSAVYGEKDLQADAKLFDVWQAAVELGNAVLQQARRGEWVESSVAADYISTEKRLDSWNHAFCLLRRDDTLVVISAGPSAPSSPVCKNIQVERWELAQLPRMRLLQSASGFLILVMESRDQPASAMSRH